MPIKHNQYRALDSDDQLPDGDNAMLISLNHTSPEYNSPSRSSLSDQPNSSAYELIENPNIKAETKKFREYVSQLLVRALVLLTFKDQTTMPSKQMTTVFRIPSDISGEVKPHSNPQEGLDGFYAQFRRSGGARIALDGV